MQLTFSEFFVELWRNKVLISACVAWLVAQVLKTVIEGLVNGDWRFERMWGSGGMPSSHAATVSSLVITTAINYGPNSFNFTISFLFAVIVLHDARGVRLETGKQAEIINAIMRFLRMEDHTINLPATDLKELIGHTPLQVGVGSVIGIIVGLLIH